MTILKTAARETNRIPATPRQKHPASWTEQNRRTRSSSKSLLDSSTTSCRNQEISRFKRRAEGLWEKTFLHTQLTFFARQPPHSPNLLDLGRNLPQIPRSQVHQVQVDAPESGTNFGFTIHFISNLSYCIDECFLN